MSMYSTQLQSIESNPRTWLVTGAAGFIGSNIVEKLLRHGQKVRGLDNFSTGYQKNLDMVQTSVGKKQWHNFQMIEGDIRDLDICRMACKGVHHILHQAALGSVPRSIEDPILTNSSNIDGFLNMLVSARDEKATFVYAASSSTYGDEPSLPKQEEKIGSPLSPYAITKYVNELYANIFAKSYNFKSIGLRYFNVFGKRQDPNGAYAAVIPQWFSAMLSGKKVFINGDGETSRDFCYIENCVQANILASCSQPEAWDNVYNVAFGERTTLNELFYLIRNEVTKANSSCKDQEPIYQDFRPGDVRHSLADISKAKKMIGYTPKVNVREGLELAGKWYSENLN